MQFSLGEKYTSKYIIVEKTVTVKQIFAKLEF